MAEDFYIDDYGGGFYDGGGGDYYGSGVGDDFTYGYGFDQPLDPPFVPGPSFEDIPLSSMPDPDVTYGSPFEDPFFGHLEHYLGMWQNLDTAYALAEQDRAAEVPVIFTHDPLPLPDIPPYTPLPYVTPYTPFETPPIIPSLEEFFPLPPLPPSPTTPQLPPACRGGTYHPYPIGHPQQDICIPFPPAQQQQQRGPQTSGQSAQRPQAQQQKPPTQQCPQGYCRNPQTGQCIPIPQGYYRNAQTQVCTPLSAQASPLPTSTNGADDAAKTPSWAWLILAALGVVLVSRRS